MDKTKRQIVRAVVVSVMALGATVASAQFTGGDYKDKSAVTTVKELRSQGELGQDRGLLGDLVGAAKTADRKVILEGSIVEKLDRNAYVFVDATGRLNVEIDSFRGVKVGPTDIVRLYGEADYDEGGLMVEVDFVKIVKKKGAAQKASKDTKTQEGTVEEATPAEGQAASPSGITTVRELKRQGELGKGRGLLGGLVAAAKTDELKVVLQGHLVERLDDNEYVFKDATGHIPVEIDSFGGVKVTTENVVKLYGEADYDDVRLVVEVKRIEVVK